MSVLSPGWQRLCCAWFAAANALSFFVFLSGAAMLQSLPNEWVLSRFHTRARVGAGARVKHHPKQVIYSSYPPFPPSPLLRSLFVSIRRPPAGRPPAIQPARRNRLTALPGPGIELAGSVDFPPGADRWGRTWDQTVFDGRGTPSVLPHRAWGLSQARSLMRRVPCVVWVWSRGRGKTPRRRTRWHSANPFPVS